MSSGLDKTIRRFADQLSRPKPNSILYNRFVLYFVFFVALSNLFIGAFQKDFVFCTYFILIGFILTFFNKNMIVVLVLTIVFSNIMRISSGSGIEGLENKEEAGKDEAEKKEAGKEGADETLKYTEIKDEKTGATASDKTPAAASHGKGEKAKTDMVDSIKKDAEKLIDTQNKIIGGFEKIDPYMKQAEQLIEKIDSTAKQIETINQSKVDQYKNSK